MNLTFNSVQAVERSVARRVPTAPGANEDWNFSIVIVPLDKDGNPPAKRATPAANEDWNFSIIIVPLDKDGNPPAKRAAPAAGEDWNFNIIIVPLDKDGNPPAKRAVPAADEDWSFTIVVPVPLEDAKKMGVLNSSSPSKRAAAANNKDEDWNFNIVIVPLDKDGNPPAKRAVPAADEDWSFTIVVPVPLEDAKKMGVLNSSTPSKRAASASNKDEDWNFNIIIVPLDDDKAKAS